MNYLKTLFPICNTLPNHLLLHSSLTESEILESTKSFPYTILVCDKSTPESPFNGSSAPPQFRFSELSNIAKEKRHRRNQLFVEDSLESAPWFRLHAIVGDTLLRYFFERASLFRALDNSECPNFVIQIAGTPVFGSNNGKRTKEGAKTKKKRKVTVDDEVMVLSERIVDRSEGTKRKKHRRGKKKKKRKLANTQQLPSTLSVANLTQPSLPTPPILKNTFAASLLRIPATRLLYCFDLRERFIGTNHPIASAAKRKCALDRSLLEKTFGLTRDDPIMVDAGPSVNALIPLLSRWIRLHRRHPCYGSYLNLFCPIDDSLLSNDAQLPKLVSSHCPKFRVKRALEAIFSHVIPVELFGENNTNRLLNAIVQFVISAGRYDSISLHQLASCVKTSKCWWLRGIENDGLRQHLLLRILNLVLRYLLKIVSSCFYITESQSEKYQLFFYRKPIWNRISRLAATQFISRCNLVPIDKNSITQEPFYGPFTLRWIPKSGGEVRPIVCNQLGQRRLPWDPTTVMAMNKELKPILAIAQFLVRQKPGVLGHTISNFKEICTRWSAYVQRAKNGKPEPVQHYVVKADITGCFDSINQQVLWDILNESLLKDAPGHYSLHGHDMIRSSATHASRKHRYAVRTLAKYESLARHYTNLEKSGGAGFKAKSGTLVVPKGGPILKSKQEVIALLRQLIFRRILTFGGDRRKYLQSVGISQGSSLSVLLCNLYLAALEKKHLDSLIMESEDILMRHTDDFLYVTPSLERAQKFAEIVSIGFPDFNCFFKLKKTVTNAAWELPISSELAIIMSSNDRGTSKNEIAWCGLLFHADTLNVSVECHRWQSTDSRNFIVVDYSKYPPSYVVQKVLYYLRIRISAIIFDKSINSPYRIRRSVNQIVRIASKWYGAYVQAYEKSRVVSPNGAKRLREKKFVEELAKRIHDALCRRISGATKDIVRLNMIRKLLLKAVGC